MELSTQELNYLKTEVQPADVLFSWMNPKYAYYFTTNVASYYTTYSRELYLTAVKQAQDNAIYNVAPPSRDISLDLEGEYKDYDKYIDTCNYINVKNISKVVIADKARVSCLKAVRMFTDITKDCYIYFKVANQEEYDLLLPVFSFYCDIIEKVEGIVKLKIKFPHINTDYPDPLIVKSMVENAG